jgi:hypothetical protein
VLGVATWPIYVGSVATAVAALGTIAAVLVALFYQPLRETKQKPCLALKAPEDTHFSFPDKEGVLHAITLQVSAEKGRKSAEDVEILATAMWWMRGLDRERWYTVFENRPLSWFESDEVDGRQMRMHMAPGIARRVELMKLGPPKELHKWLGWPSRAAFDEPVAFAVPPKPSLPSSTPFLASHLQWRIRLSVTARDIDTRVYEGDVHIGIKRTQEPAPTGPSRTPSSEPSCYTRISVSVEWLDFRKVT